MLELQLELLLETGISESCYAVMRWCETRVNTSNKIRRVARKPIKLYNVQDETTFKSWLESRTSHCRATDINVFLREQQGLKRSRTGLLGLVCIISPVDKIGLFQNEARNRRERSFFGHMFHERDVIIVRSLMPRSQGQRE